MSLFLSPSFSLCFFLQFDRWKLPATAGCRISGGIPNRRGISRSTGARFRCNWRHRARVTSPTSSPTSRSRMYVVRTYVRSYLYIAFLAMGRTERDEKVTEGQKGGQEKDKDGPRRAARETEREIRVYPSLVMRMGTSPYTRRLLFARSITVTYGHTVSKGWVANERTSERAKHRRVRG